MAGDRVKDATATGTDKISAKAFDKLARDYYAGLVTVFEKPKRFLISPFLREAGTERGKYFADVYGGNVQR